MCVCVLVCACTEMCAGVGVYRCVLVLSVCA